MFVSRLHFMKSFFSNTFHEELCWDPDRRGLNEDGPNGRGPSRRGRARIGGGLRVGDEPERAGAFASKACPFGKTDMNTEAIVS